MIVSRVFIGLAAWGLIASVAGVSFAQQRPPAQPGASNQAQPGAQNQNDQPQPGVSDRTPQRPGSPGNANNPQRPFTGNQSAGAGGFVLASQIVGLPVQSSDGQQIGTMADVLLTVKVAAVAQPMGNAATTQPNVGVDAAATPQSHGTPRWMGSNVYALINVDAFAEGRVAILPWELLTYVDGAFIVGFDVNRLGEVPSVMQGDPRLLEDMEWAQQVDEFFQDDLRQIQRARPDLENLTPDQQPRTPRQPGVDRADPTPGTPGAVPPRTPGNTPERTPPPRTSQPGTNTPQPPATPGAPGDPTP